MEKTIDSEILAPIFRAVPYMIHFPAHRYWVDYDQEADVLYISLERPQKSTHSDMTDDGILLNYRDDRLVGVTILDASTRS